MASSTPQTIDFEYLADRDLVVATPRWTIATDQDCALWYEQWTEYLGPFGRKVDCVMVLDHFFVEPAMAVRWGEYRARLTNDFMRFSFRVHSDFDVRISIIKSGIRHNAASAEAASVDEAIEGVLRARREAAAARKF